MSRNKKRVKATTTAHIHFEISVDVSSNWSEEESVARVEKDGRERAQQVAQKILKRLAQPAEDEMVQLRYKGVTYDPQISITFHTEDE